MAAFETFTTTPLVAGQTNVFKVQAKGFQVGDIALVGWDLPRLIVGVAGDGLTLTISGFFGITTPSPKRGPNPVLQKIPVLKKQKPAPGIQWAAEAGGGFVQWTEVPSPKFGLFSVVAFAIFQSTNAFWPWLSASGLMNIFKGGGVIGTSLPRAFGAQNAASLTVTMNGLKRGDTLACNAQASARFPDTPDHVSGVVDLPPLFLSTHIVGVE